MMMMRKKNFSPQEGPSGGPHLPATSTLLGSLCFPTPPSMTLLTGRTLHPVPSRTGSRAALQQQPAVARCSRRGHPRQRQGNGAPSAWAPPETPPTPTPASTPSASAASGGGLPPAPRAHSAGSPSTASCTRCERTTTTSSTCAGRPLTAAGTPPGRGSAADPLSAATTCAHGPPTTAPQLGEGGRRGSHEQTGPAQLLGPSTPPPSRLQGSASPDPPTDPSSASARCCCGPGASSSLTPADDEKQGPHKHPCGPCFSLSFKY